MTRPLVLASAAAIFCAAAAAPTPVKADPWWFLTGMVVGTIVGPAYGYPYGYRSGYAPVPATAPWAVGQQECHWAKVQHNGAWRHARICYEASAMQPVQSQNQSQFSDTIIHK
jgi:hypothetical protein